MRILRQLSATILTVALLIPFVASAAVVKPALDIGLMAGDAGAELTGDSSSGFDLTIDATAFAIVQESAPAIDITNQTFTLNASFDGSTYFVGTFNAGGLLWGDFDNLTLKQLSSGTLDFSADLNYLGGSLKGSLSGGRLEGLGSTTDLIAKLGPVVVPIPAAIWLFGSGLLGLVGFARRKAA